MTVLEFPQAPGSLPGRPHSDEKRKAEAFFELEGPLCDCVTMASIAAQIATNARTDDDHLIFAVCHVSEMLDKLKAAYYAAFNGDAALDQ